MILWHPKLHPFSPPLNTITSPTGQCVPCFFSSFTFVLPVLIRDSLRMKQILHRSEPAMSLIRRWRRMLWPFCFGEGGKLQKLSKDAVRSKMVHKLVGWMCDTTAKSEHSECEKAQKTSQPCWVSYFGAQLLWNIYTWILWSEMVCLQLETKWRSQTTNRCEW